MAARRNFLEKIRKGFGLDKYGIPILMVLMLSVIIVVVYYSQKLSEQTSLPPIITTSSKEQYEIAKLAAEIRQIRSDTSGSLFWLKMIALFVTVGGAVGGYLVGQKQTTRKRLEFENLKNIDAIYQGIVLELADKSPVLRAAAAVRLGMILKSFPSEWVVDDARKQQMIQLTRQVLAASLAIEKDPKVLKTLTIALVLHKYSEDDPKNPGNRRTMGDVRDLDLSGAKAVDAYWARVNFSYSDFYKANLAGASFRSSVLQGAQFREAVLRDAVFVDANCEEANFKLADLRKANLTNATLVKARFEEAKVFGCVLTGAKLAENPNDWVDDSEDGGSRRIRVTEWLALHR
jgi:uncharacterized protein YjbI with pentapeptide repeats